VSISPITVVLSAELLEEEVAPMCPYENAGQPDKAPVSVGYADEEDEEDEDDDDLDEDEEDEDEELDEEDEDDEDEEDDDDEDE
jgi:hypothetical protein